MSDQKTVSSGATSGSAPQDGGKKGNPFARFFRAIALFVGQVVDEMRKVVPPSRQELTSYTIVVIVFVTVVMLVVFGLDAAFTKLMFWIFAGD
ncbi:preprotein translocase subunit SecE [Agilicoccus flavus]|uniref:preprotein translocase subunit SecE n=1 Tax=Agilicoccus flavus TaxID=2775968 RepID=UPI001CF66FCB|nr:preprotein translocase subunit SecE [Agilicoccus flavus]